MSGKARFGCGTAFAKLAKAYPKARVTGGGIALVQGNRALSFTSGAGRVGQIALQYAKDL